MEIFVYITDSNIFDSIIQLIPKLINNNCVNTVCNRLCQKKTKKNIEEM